MLQTMLFDSNRETNISDESPCKTCKDYEACRIPKQVCYRDIVRKYGLSSDILDCFR